MADDYEQTAKCALTRTLIKMPGAKAKKMHPSQRTTEFQLLLAPMPSDSSEFSPGVLF
jgi:hypothetical protein